MPGPPASAGCRSVRIRQKCARCGPAIVTGPGLWSRGAGATERCRRWWGAARFSTGRWPGVFAGVDLCSQKPAGSRCSTRRRPLGFGRSSRTTGLRRSTAAAEPRLRKRTIRPVARRRLAFPLGFVEPELDRATRPCDRRCARIDSANTSTAVRLVGAVAQFRQLFAGRLAAREYSL